MHGIDAGQPAFCRGIDWLCLISSHSLLARNKETMSSGRFQIHELVRSCVNPPSLRCSLGEERRGLQLTTDSWPSSD